MSEENERNSMVFWQRNQTCTVGSLAIIWWDSVIMQCYLVTETINGPTAERQEK